MKKLLLFVFFYGIIHLWAFTQIPTEGLVAWYPFYGNAHDESGNGYNGSVNGATLTFDRFGNPNSAYNFNGSNSYITANLYSLPTISFSFWFRSPEPVSSWPALIFYNHLNCNISGIGQPDFGYVNARIQRVPYGYGASSNYAPAYDTWHHVYFEWTEPTERLKLYIDGSFQNFGAFEAADGATGINNNVIIFGVHTEMLPDTFLTGEIDNIRIYNRPLSENEILALYSEVPCTPMPTIANAGPNQIIDDDTATFLAGNTPIEGTGLWTIVSGTGGANDNPSNPSSSFHGPANHSYTLRWTISNDCGSSYDEVMICFMPEVPTEGLVAKVSCDTNQQVRQLTAKKLIDSATQAKVVNAFIGVPKEHSKRLMDAILPAIRLLSDPAVTMKVGTIDSISTDWEPMYSAYTNEVSKEQGTKIGERFTCSIKLTKLSKPLSYSWYTYFPERTSFLYFSIAEINLTDLLRPVFKRLSQSLLAKIAVEDENSYIRGGAIEKVTDQSLLAKIAMEGKDSYIGRVAVYKLNDQSLLTKIALEDEDPEVRLAVVWKVTDQSLLAKIAVEDKDPYVREEAQRILDNLRKAERK